MREKKYANVLLEDEEKEKAKKIKDVDDDTVIDGVKLSMTRELKFKELQEELNKKNKEEEVEEVKEINEDYDLTNTSEREIIKKRFENFIDKPLEEDKGPTIEDRDAKDELAMPKVKGEKRIVGAYANKEEKVPPKKEVEYNEDDLYLTTAFKPLKQRFKLSKLFKTILFIIVLIGVGVSLYFFGVKPLFNLYINSKPEMIYNNTIDYVTEEILGMVDILYTSDDGRYLDAQYDLHFKDKEELNGKYEIILGTDKKYQDKEATHLVIDGNNKYGMRVLENNKKKYTNFYGTYVYIEDEEDTEDDSFNDAYDLIFEKLGTNNKDDMIYLVNEYSKIVKEIVKTSDIETKKDEIDVDNETIKVVRNTLEIDEDKYDELSKKIYDSVKEDKKLVKTSAGLFAISEDEFLDKLDKVLKDNKGKIYFNIYTKNGTDVMGVDIEKNGFRTLYWYRSLEGKFTLYLNLSRNENCEGKDCASVRRVITAEGEEKSDYTDVKVSLNSEKIADLKVKSITKDRIDLDFDVKYKEKKYEGSCLIHLNTDSQKYDIDLEIDGVVKIKINISLNIDDNITKMESPTILSYSDDNYLKELELYANDMKDEKLLERFAYSEQIFINGFDFVGGLIDGK